MEVITIENTAFAKLLSNLESLTDALKHQTEQPKGTEQPEKPQHVLGEKWLDNEEVCQLLKVTKRTLQNYRDNFVLPYSQIGKKIFYKASDVQKVLEQNYIHLDTS